MPQMFKPCACHCSVFWWDMNWASPNLPRPLGPCYSSNCITTATPARIHLFTGSVVRIVHSVT